MKSPTREATQHPVSWATKAALLCDHAYDGVCSVERADLACCLVDLLPDDVEQPHVWWSALNGCHEFIWQRDEKILRAWVLDGQVALYAAFGREEREAIEDFGGEALPPLLGQLLERAFRWQH